MKSSFRFGAPSFTIPYYSVTLQLIIYKYFIFLIYFQSTWWWVTNGFRQGWSTIRTGSSPAHATDTRRVALLALHKRRASRHQGKEDDKKIKRIIFLERFLIIIYLRPYFSIHAYNAVACKIVIYACWFFILLWSLNDGIRCRLGPLQPNGCKICVFLSPFLPSILSCRWINIIIFLLFSFVCVVFLLQYSCGTVRWWMRLLKCILCVYKWHP